MPSFHTGLKMSVVLTVMMPPSRSQVVRRCHKYPQKVSLDLVVSAAATAWSAAMEKTKRRDSTKIHQPSSNWMIKCRTAHISTSQIPLLRDRVVVKIKLWSRLQEPRVKSGPKHGLILGSLGWDEVLCLSAQYEVSTTTRLRSPRSPALVAESLVRQNGCLNLV